MKTKKTTPIIPGIIYSQLKDTHTFKEITETEELEKAFRLRYEVYSSSKMSGFLKQKNVDLDIDTYDLHSRHFGLFAGNNELIGYFRIVFGRGEYYNDMAFEVGQKLGAFNVSEHNCSSIKDQPTSEFPFLSYQNLPETVKNYYDNICNSNEKVRECTRLVLKENYRGLRTAAFMIECAMVIYYVFCDDQKHAVICCGNENILFYKRYGFQPIGDGQSFITNGRNNKIMGLSLSNMPAYIFSKIEGKLSEYLSNNQINKAL